MKKILKLTAMVLGTFAILFGLNSCSKDDDNNDNDCCTWDESYTDGGETYTYTGKVCEDGTFSGTYTVDGETYTNSFDWTEDSYYEDYSWDDIKDEFCS